MIRIRRSRPADGQRAVEIWRAAVDATHHFLSAEDRRSIDAEVQRFLPDMPLWLAVDESDVAVAFMGLDGAEMEALFVHPAHHGRGIGRALVEHAIALNPILTTTVNEQNAQAIGFYERLGFRQTGRADLDEQGRSYPVLFLRIDTSHPAMDLNEAIDTFVAIIPEHDLSLAEIDAIEDRIYDHNRRMTERDDARGLAYVIRDRGGVVVGACAGYSWAGSAELKQLWIDESLRGHGYGRKLLDAFLAEAERRKVRQIWLASYSFQAPEFYERVGFERMAEFPDWPSGHANVILRKVLSR